MTNKNSDFVSNSLSGNPDDSSDYSSDYFAIVADVGGTHIRFGALLAADAPLQFVKSYLCADFPSLDEAITAYQKFLQQRDKGAGRFEVLCLALPGDVQAEQVKLVNLPWVVDPAELAKRFHCRCLVVNDFSAQAYAITDFKGADLHWLRSGTISGTTPGTTTGAGFNRAIIGPGTGLGVAALLPNGQVVESEGGHLSFAPQNELQQQLLTALWSIYPRVSVERLVSGPGLANVYRGLCLLNGQERQLGPEQITAGARSGDALCESAVALFCQLLGSVCGDLAVTFAAKGGIYVSGGLLSGLGELFDEASFLECFDNKGRYHNYCQQIPIARVLSAQPGLIGATRFAKLHADAPG